MEQGEFKKELTKTIREYGQTGLRWSYLVIIAMTILGALVNLFLPHGWVIWPAVLAVGIMVLINDATDRNTQGIPPLQAYAWFASAITIWIAMAVLFSALFPLIVIVGIPTMIFFAVRFYLRNRKRNQLIADRRAKGLCIHCGEKVDAQVGCCEHCGKELDATEGSLLKRLQASDRSQEDIERARDILNANPPTVAAKRKEQALLAKRPRKSTSTKPQLPPNESV